MKSIDKYSYDEDLVQVLAVQLPKINKAVTQAICCID